MRPYLYLIPTIFFLILWSSCRKDFEYAPSAGHLEFSRDTVYLDTVFTNIGSSTYTLKVYNRNRDDVEIPSIRLGQGQNSQYRLNVDGVAGKEFLNVPILAQDSLFIFIETTYDFSGNPGNEFLYIDAIQFDSGIYQQNVQLVTLVKDAVFLYPSTLSDGTKETLVLGLDDNGNEIRTEGFYLAETQLNFTNQKPYVIYGYAVVDTGNVLSMDAGTRVYFHKDSGIYIAEGASMTINGELSLDPELLENEVIFEGDRLEREFAEAPGQWGLIWMASGSTNNSMNHLTIKNATIGVLVEGDELLQSTTLTIRNTQIYNSSQTNLWANNAAIVAENMVLGGAGKNSLYCNIGGDYEFTHCTIANYWKHGFRTGSALLIDNFKETTSGVELNGDLVKAKFYNCIIDGSSNKELSLRSNEANIFNYSFNNCLIKYGYANGQDQGNPLYDFANTAYYNQIYLNEDAEFKDAPNNDFTIGETSFVEAKADLETSLLVPLDILGIDRTSSPEIGAYEIILGQ